MNPDKIMNLAQQHGDVAFEEGMAFAREQDELVKTYAHRRAVLFEKIQEEIYRLQINNVKLNSPEME